ncbi:MAG: heparinase II/III family protein, partial [Bryobacteraceae bacterium]
MRSVAELTFRARQEAANLKLLASPPVFRGEVPRALSLPDPAPVAAALRESEFARFAIATAGEILEHRFPLFGNVIETGPEIRWRRDYAHGKESGVAYFRRIPYLNFSAVGGHKFVWELNRHQHLVLLAQAFLFTREDKFTREIFVQLESWLDQNPFQCGINWSSALEVAFRALSWIWVY